MRARVRARVKAGVRARARPRVRVRARARAGARVRFGLGSGFGGGEHGALLAEPASHGRVCAPRVLRAGEKAHLVVPEVVVSGEWW